MPSQLVINFEDRLRTLRKRFLPLRWSRTGSYAPDLQDQFRAYRVLAHAETEHCLEQLVLRVANQSVSAWKADRRPRRSVVALLATYSPSDLANYWDFRTSSRIGRPLLVATNHQDVVQAVDRALSKFKQTVSNNHGIKESNLLKLAHPVGVKRHDLDDLWLAELDAFGAARGAVAHTTGAAVQLLDPKTELVAVERIRKGARAFERVLDRLTKP